MEEVYDGLNKYLNEICKYLEENDTFFLNNIYRIEKINDTFLRELESYNFDNETKENNLTFMDVYLLAREVISQIDENYLKTFDKIISNGELDFSYENGYKVSHVLTTFVNNEATRELVNINREFNYNDVKTLVHEFMHYINSKKDTKNWHYLTEFLSIYFEEFAIDYLLNKGIEKNEIDLFERFKNTKNACSSLYQYEVILLAYHNFGNIDEDSYKYVHQLFNGVSEEAFKEGFNIECTKFYNKLRKIEEENKERLKENPDNLGGILCSGFIDTSYRYVLGTFLALYARKCAKFESIVYLNNHLSEFEDKSLYEILLSIGIDLKDTDLEKNAYESLRELVNSRQDENKISK